MGSGAGWPKVLWLTEEPPDPGLGGGNIRQAHLFRALSARVPVELMVTGRVRDPGIREAAARLTELSVPPARRTDHPIGRRALELGISLFSPHPLPLYSARPARSAILKAIRASGRRYELIAVEHEALAPLVHAVPGDRWMITLHNLLSGTIASELALAPGRRQRWFRARDSRKAVALERRTLNSFDACVVCSSDDARALSQIAGPTPRARVEVVPNGVDLHRFQAQPPPAEPRLLFPGTLSYPPNVDGALWFCSEVWPRVRSMVPGATLCLAGREPVRRIMDLGELPGVTVAADVASMVEFFNAARAVVVPLRIGTGTRLKALEAMGAGRPVIGTTVGLEGIGAVDGVNALVADDPADLARAVALALTDDDLARRLGATGRRHVEDGFGWDTIAERFGAFAESMLS